MKRNQLLSDLLGACDPQA